MTIISFTRSVYDFFLQNILTISIHFSESTCSSTPKNAIFVKHAVSIILVILLSTGTYFLRYIGLMPYGIKDKGDNSETEM